MFIGDSSVERVCTGRVPLALPGWWAGLAIGHHEMQMGSRLMLV